MKTCYFDRNIFDQIDKKRDVTDEDIAVLRRAVSDGDIAILVSFETVQETTYARRDTALRGLRLISELSRPEFPIKPHTELVSDEIQSFATGKKPPMPFLNGRFSLNAVISDIEQSSAEVVALVEDDKLNKAKLNTELEELIVAERDFIRQNRPRTFEMYWEQRSPYLVEVFADRAGCLRQCQELGIHRLLELRAVRVSVGALLSLLYAVLIEGRRVRNGTSRDLQHAGPMSAADVIVTDDGELRRLLNRIPLDRLTVIDLPALVQLLRLKGDARTTD
jgi:hypothetical protein